MFQRICTPALATCSSGCPGLGLQKNTAYRFLPSFPKKLCKGGVKINRLIANSNQAQSGPEKTIDLLENYVDEGRGPELESDDAEHPSVAQVIVSFCPLDLQNFRGLKSTAYFLVFAKPWYCRAGHESIGGIVKRYDEAQVLLHRFWFVLVLIWFIVGAGALLQSDCSFKIKRCLHSLITWTPNVCRDAIQIFLGRGISGAPVVDAAGHLVGVLSETDIILRETGENQK